MKQITFLRSSNACTCEFLGWALTTLWGVVNSLLGAYWVLSAYFLAVLEISVCAYKPVYMVLGYWRCQLIFLCENYSLQCSSCFIMIVEWTFHWSRLHIHWSTQLNTIVGCSAEFNNNQSISQTWKAKSRLEVVGTARRHDKYETVTGVRYWGWDWGWDLLLIIFEQWRS